MKQILNFKKYRAGVILILPFLCSGCSITENPSLSAIIGLFVIMILLFVAMIVIIVRKKRQSVKSLAKFTVSMQNMLKKFETPQEKAQTLLFLLERIDQDEKYQKDEKWKNKVLAKVYLSLATQYYRMGDQTKILDACNHIIELDPKDGQTYYNRGTLFSNMGMYEKALDDLDHTIELIPKYADAYNNRGLVLEKMNLFDAAIADYTKALKLRKTGICFYNRANCYYKHLDDPKSALSDFKQSLSLLSPENTELIASVKEAISQLEK